MTCSALNRRQLLTAAGMFCAGCGRVDRRVRHAFFEPPGVARPDLSRLHDLDLLLQPASWPSVLPSCRPAGSVSAFQCPRGRAFPRRPWSILKHDDAYINLLRSAYYELAKICDHSNLFWQMRMHALYCTNRCSQHAEIHNTWMFLPWHRAFIYFHERVLVRILGRPDFRLPVWDWDFCADVPRFYQQLGVPDFLNRNSGRNLSPLPSETVDPHIVDALLASKTFKSFCGPPYTGIPPTSAASPHKPIHTKIGGAMAQAELAAADPIFFTHHANMDRLWERWKTLHPSEARPSPDWAEQWLDSTFYLYDEHDQLVAVTPRHLESTEKLGYYYESGDLEKRPGLIAQPAVPATQLRALRDAVASASGDPIPCLLTFETQSSLGMGLLVIRVSGADGHYLNLAVTSTFGHDHPGPVRLACAVPASLADLISDALARSSSLTFQIGRENEFLRSSVEISEVSFEFPTPKPLN